MAYTRLQSVCKLGLIWHNLIQVSLLKRVGRLCFNTDTRFLIEASFISILFYSSSFSLTFVPFPFVIGLYFTPHFYLAIYVASGVSLLLPLMPALLRKRSLPCCFSCLSFFPVSTWTEWENCSPSTELVERQRRSKPSIKCDYYRVNSIDPSCPCIWMTILIRMWSEVKAAPNVHIIFKY